MTMSGQYAPGDQLESVSHLSSRLKVNPMTISKAHSLLVSEGVAERRPGVGIFVAEINEKKAHRDRQKLLVSALKEAAAVVVQLGASTHEAVTILQQHIDQFQRNHGRRKP